MRSSYAAVALATSVAAFAAGCGTSMRHVRRAARPSHSVKLAPPPVVIARRAVPSAPGGLRRGTRLPAAELGVRVFADGHHGFSLATVARREDGTYPAVTNDGGRIWRVAGPVLHIAAAQGALAVSEAGVAGPRFYFAWCRGAANQVVDVTTDAGRHWWQVFLPGSVLAVTGDGTPGGGVTAIVEGPTPAANGGGASLWVYRTANGHRWKYRAS
jgi:hypothetical protein